MVFKLATYFLGFISGVVSIILYAYFQVPKIIPLLLSSSTSTIHDINQTVGADMSTWFNKLFDILSSQSVVHTLTNGSPIEVGIGLMLLFTSVMWLLSYQVGLFLNLRYSKIGWPKRILFHLQTLVLCLVIGLIETFPAFWAMIEYCIRNKVINNKIKTQVYDFYVINK
jgi:hypothetical protein